jgi:FlaA1/EpsC-like NDP-sugar epimerase
MIINYYKYLNNFLSIDRNHKKLIIILFDIGLCLLCTWLAFIIRYEELVFLKGNKLLSALISASIAIPIFWIFKIYKSIFRYTNLSIILSITSAILLYGVFFFSIISIYGLKDIPRSIGVSQPILLYFSMISSRLLLLKIFNKILHNKENLKKKNILIYGAGNAGRQLASALENNLEYQLKGFLDDDPLLIKQYLLGYKVFSPKQLKELIINLNIDLIFLAIPAINRNQKLKIIDYLKKFQIRVKTLPSISQIVNDTVTLSDIKDLDIDDLLNRNEIKINNNFLIKQIKSKNILVTGGGGSIGSEICRQVLKFKPAKLIILEMNEFSLYKISEEFKNNFKDTSIKSILVNAQDQKRLEIIFETFKIDTVYHAAAYKHVPLVEENICEGVKNNVFSSISVTNASINTKVKNLVLISSDKAVRPTNIMGATKRLSELYLQAISDHLKSTFLKFSIVRFGNVLESSGSVIPKFKEQIRNGGPITLTHNDVTRYFMTTTEAAQLVIQAGIMGKKCEVFLLDMGKRVKIKDLIYKMITLSGFSIKDKNNPNGDIEIKIIGLRPGEKLHEELIINDNQQQTENPKIFKVVEPFMSYEKLENYIKHLNIAINTNNVTEVKKILTKVVKLYISNSEIVDNIYIEQNSKKIIKQKISLP